MSITIRIITDNYVYGGDFKAEHGFSAVIEAGEKLLLFDTGKTPEIFRYNFGRTGISANDIEFGIISHGHYDHTGGLAELLKLRQSPLKIFAHPDIFSNRFAVDPDGKLRYIGIYWSKQYLEGLGAEFEFTKRPLEIFENVWVSGEIPRILGFEGRSPRFKRVLNDKLVEDTIPDDMAVYIATPEGLVILVGCCHAGLLNTISHAIEVTGVEKIRLVLGGTHLGGYPLSKLNELFEKLKKFDIKEFRLSHCTGMRPFAELYKIYPDRVNPTKVGEVIKVG